MPSSALNCRRKYLLGTTSTLAVFTKTTSGNRLPLSPSIPYIDKKIDGLIMCYISERTRIRRITAGIRLRREKKSPSLTVSQEVPAEVPDDRNAGDRKRKSWVHPCSCSYCVKVLSGKPAGESSGRQRVAKLRKTVS